MRPIRVEKVLLTRSEAEVLASIAEMVLDASGLSFSDWIAVNADKHRTLTRAYNKVSAAYKAIRR